MPTGRLKCLARLLEMMRHERRALVELVEVELLESHGYPAMEPRTMSAQVRSIRHFSSQWMLERVLRL